MSTNFYDQSKVLYANNTFIASSQLGVSISADGISWTDQTFSTAQGLGSLAYGNGTWVMVDDRFLTTDVVAFMVSSTNGASWSQVLTTISYAQPNCVAFGNGQFVVVGYGGLVARSSNGSTWSAQSLGTSSDGGVMAVTYGNSQFVAVTNSGKAFHSADGTSWTMVSVSANALTGITYGNGVFAAVGGGGIYTSPDAVTWTSQTCTGLTSGGLNNVAFGNSKFVAVGSSFAISQ
jgi:hypothetical protein